jgi:alkanesulfonate monooxygenase SsuD/methylene tetrahydromethanopterin reductase-like flavin-dependent oxidoreductase (luciferase family)
VQVGLVDLFDGSPERGAEFIQGFARAAEECGFAGIWLPEHMLFFDQYTSAYPYPAAPSASDPDRAEIHNKTVDGKPRVEASADQGLLDLFQTALHALRATTTLRFGSSVLLLPVRNPVSIVRELKTLSELTADRFDLGVGVGWSSEEIEACETDFTTRGKRCEDMMTLVNDLWADDAGLYPATSQPVPRMLVGGHSRAAIRRAAQIGTGWYPWNLTMPQFAEHYETYRAQLSASGRDIDEQQVVAGLRFTGDPHDLPAIVEGYARIGADAVNVSLRTEPGRYRETMGSVSRALGLAA